ncbi:hypothetical protein K3G63_04845 [Hymenobacter sp. HSC-4F20]|uniref:hypothetical protein n=1 Tax=Hymenobacter sp. HSC-4F20 TaxID=2864135 RepID=UPI001C73CC8F|nr:hypothetical protein [Hymenobacter sp. HSC-4F20]MBX0289752.1 hypothetical protein [Hymenobacter sp. HSC-4F20]
MQIFLRSLAVAAALTVSGKTSAFTPVCPKPEHRATSYVDYQNGYAQGKRETEQNKCIDGDRFQQNYYTYRQRVELNLAYASTQEEYDYYQGYLDGMEEGYNTPVMCGSPGGGGGTGSGGGTGPGGGPIVPILD